MLSVGRQMLQMSGCHAGSAKPKGLERYINSRLYSTEGYMLNGDSNHWCIKSGCVKNKRKQFTSKHDKFCSFLLFYYL